MKRKGDLVSVRIRKSNGLSEVSQGVLIKRTYLAYETKYCKWDIMLNKGVVINTFEKNISKVISSYD